MDYYGAADEGKCIESGRWQKEERERERERESGGRKKAKRVGGKFKDNTGRKERVRTGRDERVSEYE